MTTEEKKMMLDLLDKEWTLLNRLNLNNHAPLMQAASAVWSLMEYLPVREKLIIQAVSGDVPGASPNHH